MPREPTESALENPIHELLGSAPGESGLSTAQNTVSRPILLEAHSNTLKHFAYILNIIFSVIRYSTN